MRLCKTKIRFQFSSSFIVCTQFSGFKNLHRILKFQNFKLRTYAYAYIQQEHRDTGKNTYVWDIDFLIEPILDNNNIHFDIFLHCNSDNMLLRVI